MNIIKLNAIPSTNDYLKELSVSTLLPDFTIVVAEHQTNGKGQMGAVWQVESSTNLTFSVLLSGSYLRIEDIFTINIAIANSICKVLLSFDFNSVAVKWPNDIMAYNKKIGGILIENNIKANGAIQSVVGVGLNVNQINFEGLPKASSILKTYNVELDKTLLMQEILNEFKNAISNLNNNKNEQWAYYHNHLFKKTIPVTFQTNDECKFTGMILKVNELGQLGVLDENDVLKFYNLKEIKMLY